MHALNFKVPLKINQNIKLEATEDDEQRYTNNFNCTSFLDETPKCESFVSVKNRVTLFQSFAKVYPLSTSILPRKMGEWVIEDVAKSRSTVVSGC